MKNSKFAVFMLSSTLLFGSCGYSNREATKNNAKPNCYYQMDYKINSGIGILSNNEIMMRQVSIVTLAGEINTWNLDKHSIFDLTILENDTVYFPSICDFVTVENFIAEQITTNEYSDFLTIKLKPSEKEIYYDIYKRSE